MQRNRVLEAHETVPQFLELVQKGIAGDSISQAILFQRYPRLKKSLKAIDRALDLADTPHDANNLAPCLRVGLDASRDVLDRTIGKPTERVEVSGVQDFQASLVLAFKIEARLKELDGDKGESTGYSQKKKKQVIDVSRD